MLDLQAHTYLSHLTISQIQPKFLIMFSGPLLLQVDLQAQHDLSKNPSLLPTVHCILTVTMDARITHLELDHIAQTNDLNPHLALQVTGAEKKQVTYSLSSQMRVRQIEGYANFASEHFINNLTT